MKVKIVRAIAVLLIVAAVALYAYGVVVKGDAPTQNLARTVIIGLSGLSALLKTMPKRTSLSKFATAYAKELGSAFSTDLRKRERLLGAIRLYNEDKFPAAIAELEKLQAEAVTQDEIYAVGLFTALCQEAIATYEGTADRGAGRSQLYSNLGTLYAGKGDPRKAAECYRKATELDPANPLPYNNLAHLLLQVGAYEDAAAAAGRAIDLNPGQYQAWTAMAIVAGVQGDAERQEECVRKAVACGQDEAGLRWAIARHVQIAEMSREEA